MCTVGPIYYGPARNSSLAEVGPTTKAYQVINIILPCLLAKGGDCHLRIMSIEQDLAYHIHTLPSRCSWNGA